MKTVLLKWINGVITVYTITADVDKIVFKEWNDI